MKFDTTTEEVNEEEAAFYKKKLLEQLEGLFGDSGITMHEMQDAVLEFPDPADRAPTSLSEIPLCGLETESES